jgi:hypothetical protein
LDRIVASLFDDSSGKTSKNRLAFSAGSHVLWTPIFINPVGQLKRTEPISGKIGWTEGWLASRSPPYQSTNGLSGSVIDITSLVLDEKSSPGHVQVLYDNRFVLSLHLHAIPDRILDRLRTPPGVHRLIVTAMGKYFLPRLVFRSSKGQDIEDIGMPGPAPKTGSVATVPGSDLYSSEIEWVNWRFIREFK